MGNINAALGPLTIAALAIPGGQPVAGILHAIKTVGGITKSVVDMIVPTDLEQITTTLSGTTLPIGQTAQASYSGEFQAQDNVVIGTIRVFISTTMAIVPGLSAGPGVDEGVKGITEEVAGMLLEAGINVTDAVSAEALSSLRSSKTGVPLDMSVYRLDVISLLQLVMPGLPTDKISNFLERAGVDLGKVTFFAPVESENSTVATYSLSSGQITGVGAGSTRLSVNAYKFRAWENRANLLGFHIPVVVGPFYSQTFNVTSPTFEVSGRVTTGSSGLSSVTMTLSGATSRTAITDASGNYSFTGVPSGSYTVRPSKSGYTFSQTSQTVTVSGANRTGIHFTGSPSPFPDLLVDQLTPTTISENVPTVFRVRVANIGTGSASNARVILKVDGQEKSGLSVTVGANQEAIIEFDAVTFSAGSHTVEVVADPNGVFSNETNRSNNSLSRTLTTTTTNSASQSLVFVLDLSGSMNDQLADGSGTRIGAAKKAIEQVLSTAASEGAREYALVTFGGNCLAQVTVPFTTSPQTVVTTAKGLSATGSTPLAEGLRAGQHLALDLASSNNVQIVLLSDGRESCGGNPIAVAEAIGQGRRAKLAQARVISLNVIGMGVTPGGVDEEQIQAIARASGGNYFRTSQTTDLASALGQASGLQQRVPTLSGVVTDAQGNPVQGARVQLRTMREDTDANGRYVFPNTSGVQGVDSLVVIATGFKRYAAEVFLFDADKTFDVRLTPDASAFPTAVATASPASVDVGGQVTLRGDQSSDPNGGQLVYHWSQLSSNPFPVGFSLNDSRDAFAVRVTLSDLGTYRFVLVVETTAGLKSQPDTVEVRASAPFNGTATLPGGASMAFVEIESGTFTMGSPSNEVRRGSDEGPEHEVSISKEYYLGKYEVTQGQWEAVMGTTPWSREAYVQANADNPAVYVSWNDAQAFVQKLNVAAGDSLYRLPSEAEWEYACRSGTTTRWSFGDDESKLKDYAWYGDNAWDVGEQYAHKVGTKLSNPWGLNDMHGNVWEWCGDRYGSYSSISQTDPQGPSSGSLRVFRGGYFRNGAQGVRLANRRSGSPAGRSNGIGFRLLRIR